MHIAIVIPVYKPVMTADEKSSLRQCVTILGHYDTFLVCPQGMDTTAYRQVLGSRYNELRFDTNYFDGIDGYNRLMTGCDFYDALADYDYMLLYQLDAWVFSDQLVAWCQKGYDYVGAPWFEDYKSYESGHQLWRVGNGGFSLRRIACFRQLTSLGGYTRVKSCRQVFRDEYRSLKDLLRCLVRCCGPWIGTNSLRHIRKRGYWEDEFFCVVLHGTKYELRVPVPEEAAFFSFERSPCFLYNNVTKGQLPFGCHAWRKFDFDTFWSDKMVLEQ